MNDLVKVKKNDLFTDSLVISQETDNQHHSVTRLLRNYKGDFEEFGLLEFMDLKSTNPMGGASTKIYLLNEQQATLLMTYLGNTEIVRKFKVRLVKEFYRMRQLLIERQTTDWLKTREQGKLVRREETDAIQTLIPYAENQGSKNAKMMYLTYSKLVNKTVGIQSGTRDKATTMQLMQITMLEDLITRTILEEVAKGVYYKEIYKMCKAKANQFAGLVYLNAG